MSGARRRLPGPAADCSDEDFIRAWRLCDAKHRADRMRKRGIVLPKQEVT